MLKTLNDYLTYRALLKQLKRRLAWYYKVDKEGDAVDIVFAVQDLNATRAATEKQAGRFPRWLYRRISAELLASVNEAYTIEMIATWGHNGIQR